MSTAETAMGLSDGDEYLDSDECIDEQLSNNSDEFDEDGSIV